MDKRKDPPSSDDTEDEETEQPPVRNFEEEAKYIINAKVFPKRQTVRVVRPPHLLPQNYPIKEVRVLSSSGNIVPGVSYALPNPEGGKKSKISEPPPLTPLPKIFTVTPTQTTPNLRQNNVKGVVLHRNMMEKDKDIPSGQGSVRYINCTFNNCTFVRSKLPDSK